MARPPAFFADCVRASPWHSVMKTQKAKSKIVHWQKKLVTIMFIQCVWEIRRTGHRHNYNFFGANAAKPLKYDFPGWFWCMCELQLAMSSQNSYIYIYTCEKCVYIIYIYIYMHVAKPPYLKMYILSMRIMKSHEIQEWSEMTWAIWHLAQMDHQECRSYGDPKPFTKSKKTPEWFRGLPAFSASTLAKLSS